MNGGSRTGKIVNLVDLDIERERDIVTNEFKAGVVNEMFDVALGAGEKVVDAQYIRSLRYETIAQVRTKEACSAGYKYGL
jgi:hypothetical protein